jgi:hypothetical protein
MKNHLMNQMHRQMIYFFSWRIPLVGLKLQQHNPDLKINSKRQQSMENKLALKQKLYEECLIRQRSSVQRVKDVMKEAQESALADDENSEELFDSYREQMQHTREMYASRLLIAQNELEVLERVPASDLTPVIEVGAVVRTDNQNFFVAISLSKIDLEGSTYFPISTSSPIFQAMVGLKEGATFQFRDRKFVIKEVF